jgi:hypothetical protein
MPKKQLVSFLLALSRIIVFCGYLHFRTSVGWVWSFHPEPGSGVSRLSLSLSENRPGTIRGIPKLIPTCHDNIQVGTSSLYFYNYIPRRLY